MHTNTTKYLLNRLADYTNDGTIPLHYSGALEEALKAIDENERLRVYAPLDTSDDAQGQTQMVVDADYFNQLQAENERLRAALTMLRTSITQAPGMQSQEDDWMLGIIDQALGDEA